jgi:hypothetical protein
MSYEVTSNKIRILCGKENTSATTDKRSGANVTGVLHNEQTL